MKTEKLIRAFRGKDDPHERVECCYCGKHDAVFRMNPDEGGTWGCGPCWKIHVIPYLTKGKGKPLSELSEQELKELVDV